MSQFVPASTRIRRSRARNIDTDRLLRRQAFLVDLLRNNSRSLERRKDFVERAAELAAIENALDQRDVQYVRVTMTPAQCRAASTG